MTANLSPLESSLNELFRAPLVEFTALRKKIAADLKVAGHVDEAAVVAKAAKPTAAAWALNQLAHRYPKKVEWFFEANESVLRAQEAGNADDFRTATRARHDVVHQLAQTAIKLHTTAGGAASPALAKKISDTLYAFSSDKSAAELFRKGLLTKELSPGGIFGATEADSDSAPVSKKEATAIERAESRAQRLATNAEDLVREANDLAKLANRAANEAERARTRADRARRDAEEASTKAKEAQKHLEDLKGS